MVWQSLIGAITGPIVSDVVAGVTGYLKERNELKQFEDMQAEVLEGWIFKIAIAVERELHAAGISKEVYENIMNAIKQVVEKEVDTRKL